MSEFEGPLRKDRKSDVEQFTWKGEEGRKYLENGQREN